MGGEHPRWEGGLRRVRRHAARLRRSRAHACHSDPPFLGSEARRVPAGKGQGGSHVRRRSRTHARTHARRPWPLRAVAGTSRDTHHAAEVSCGAVLGRDTHHAAHSGVSCGAVLGRDTHHAAHSGVSCGAGSLCAALIHCAAPAERCHITQGWWTLVDRWDVGSAGGKVLWSVQVPR